MIYFRCYVEDYESATGDLSLLEHGVYFSLLRHYYRLEKPLPHDTDKLARICKAITLEERAAISAILDRYFIRTVEGWHSVRADEEIRVANTARENGKLGGNPWVKELYNEPGFLYAIRGNKPGLIKVGITVDPKRRLAEHRNKSRCGETIALIPVHQMGIAEAAVLAKFTDYATGEWLTLDNTSLELQLVEMMRTFAAPDSVPARVPQRVPDNEGEREAGSVQPFNHLTKTTLTTKTTPLPSQPNPLSADAPRRGAPKPAALTAETWEAYRGAYFTRYGEEPVRNQRVNGQLASVVRSLGGEEAPGVAAFYVLHNRQDYVKALHPTSLLARDAESLRTAWAAGRVVTDAESRQIDRTQATGAVFTKLLEDAR